LAVDAHAAVAAWGTFGVLDRRDVGPRTILGAEFPDRAVSDPAGSDAVIIDQVEHAFGVETGVDRRELRRLSRHGLPGQAGIGAAEEMRIAAALRRADRSEERRVGKECRSRW